MIAYLKGTVMQTGGEYIIVEVTGIGYKVNVPSSIFGRLPAAGGEVQVYTYLHVREDAMQLYGFLAPEELELFEILLQVSGIGPKVALTILSAMPAASFRMAIINEQLSALTAIPGVGKKTAQRMVIELKDKLIKTARGEVEAAPAISAGGPEGFDEAWQALMALGYTAGEAQKAVRKIAMAPGAPDSVQEIIRLALRELGRA
ncbi:Holliday junction branch migration protein RuvA [bacterium]|nr:MAG: Holliday junction branch migration protein RuvA [bacterium]